MTLKRESTSCLKTDYPWLDLRSPLDYRERINDIGLAYTFYYISFNNDKVWWEKPDAGLSGFMKFNETFGRGIVVDGVDLDEIMSDVVLDKIVSSGYTLIEFS